MSIGEHRGLTIVAVLLALGLPSCDRIRELTGNETSDVEAEPKKSARDRQDDVKPAQTGTGRTLAFEVTPGGSSAPGGASPLPMTPGFKPSAAAAFDYLGLHAPTAVKLVEQTHGAPLKLRDVSFHPTHAVVSVPSKTDRQKLLMYSVRAGAVETPMDFPVSPLEEEPGKLEEHLFTIADVDWAAIPRLCADAQAKVGPGARGVAHVVVHRFLPFSKDIQIRIFVNDAASGDAFVDYDAKGNLKKVTGG